MANKLMQETSTNQKSEPTNYYWEAVDYSKEKPATISALMSSQLVSAKTIQRITQTLGLSPLLAIACQHELAQIEDILVCLNRTKDQQSYPARSATHNIVNNMLNSQREKLDTYMQKAYNLNTTHMTEIQITEILGIDD
jgi:hypothetical protein